MWHDDDVARIARLFGDPARLAMLEALATGRALPAGELARCAGVTPQTASSHLGKLVAAALVECIEQGRHRYFRLVSPAVPELLEALAVLAPQPAASAQEAPRQARELRFARSCYGHLAGQVGVAVTSALGARGLVQIEADGARLTSAGRAWFEQAGIDVAVRNGGDAAPSKVCLVDWSERRPHLAGPLGVALLQRLLEQRSLVRIRAPRVLRVTDSGRAWLRERLGLELPPSP
jgi:DNA-binding transcriptional ArsR family regulator